MEPHDALHCFKCLGNFSSLFVKGHMLHKDVMVGRNPHFDGGQKYVLSSD